MTPPVSVILIRENAEQLTGSGCCGKLEGDNALWGGGEVFAEARRNQLDLGVLHRAIREFFPPCDGQSQVGVVTVDPRNQFYLVPKLWSDVWRYRPGWRTGLFTLLQMFSLPAVIVNGRVLRGRDAVVDPDTLCHVIREYLDRSSPARPCPESRHEFRS
jgi:hypothetical protein